MEKDILGKIATGKTGSSKYKPNYKLRQAREAHLFSREKLAEMVGVNARTIARWEQGDALPHAFNIRQLCESLQMSPHDLGLEVVGESAGMEQHEQVSLPTSMPMQERPKQHEGEEVPETGSTQPSCLSRRKLVIGAVAFGSVTLLGGGAYIFLHASEKKQLARYYYKAGIMGLAWSADGAYLASAHTDHSVQVWNSVTGDRTSYIHHTSGWVSDVVWSPQAEMLASVSGGSDPLLCVWNFPLENQDVLRERRSYRLTTVAWSPDGKSLAFAGRGQILEIMKVSVPGKVDVSMIADTEGVQKVRWSPDGLSLAIGTTNGAIYLYQTLQRTMSKLPKDHAGIVEDVAWSPDGKVLASASADGTVMMWDTVNWHVGSTYRGHSKKVSSVAWSPDGKALASASADGTVHLCHAGTGTLLTSYEGSSKGEINAVCWASGGKQIAFGGEKREIEVWDVS